MSMITDYFEQAQISMAAYALGLRPEMSNSDYRAALVAQGMSAKQAEVFADTYKIVDQYTEPLFGTGLSAVVFQKTTESGTEYFLAIRGTEGLLSRDFIEDLQIAHGGIARNQLISLYNYIQRLITEAGQPAPQVKDVPPSSDIDLITGNVNSYDPGGIALADPAEGLGFLAASGTTFTATGHSLGGHLAVLVSRLFDSFTDGTYTYNSPGFYLADIEGLLRQFPTDSGAFPSDITNVIANAGYTVIPNTGDMPGERKDIFIEDQGFVPPTANHRIGPLTDALAVYKLFATIDPTLNSSEGIGKITSILEASASNEVKSLEFAIDTLRTLFQKNYIEKTANDNITATGIDRDKFYSNIFSLQETLKGLPWYNSDPAVRTLNGFTVESLVANTSSDLVQKAKDQIAYRYALYILNPFAITGSNASSLYDAINTDGSLKLYDPQTRTGNITDTCLDDRAEFLAEKIGSALSNLEYQGKAWNASGGDLTYFRDYDSQFELFAGLNESVDPLPINDANEIHFGSARPDALTGGNQFDRLYGMDGSDLLIGGKSDDRLEGGMGNDVYLYRAGDGHDTIFDTDRIGLIVYVDTQGQHHLLDGGTRSPGDSGAYADATGRFRYTQNDTNLTITLDGVDAITLNNFDLARADLRLSLQERDQSQISVILPATPDADVLTAATSADTELMGNEGADVVRGAGGDDSVDGGTGSDWLNGNLGNDTLEGGEGNDFLAGGPGYDVLKGGAGNDLLVVHASSGANEAVPFFDPDGATGAAGVTVTEQDWRTYFQEWQWSVGFLQNEPSGRIEARIGFDFLGPQTPTDPNAFRGIEFYTYGLTGLDTEGDSLFGGGGNDTLIGYLGADNLSGDEGDDHLDGLEGNDQLLGGSGDDWITGSLGDDFISGGPETLGSGTDNDTLYGEEGDDLIFGGAGDDVIEGDFHSASLTLDRHGNDTLFGGTGDDQVYGQGGEDYLDGEDGTDQLVGGAGADTIFGGSGDDQLFGDSAELAEADHGDDYLDGEDGNDYLRGFGGNDTLLGGTGDDQLLGEMGDDELEGGEGADALYGMDGDDTLEAGAGNDQMVGGIGNDTYIFNLGDGQDDIFDAAGAFDSLQLAGIGTEGVRIEGINNDLVITINGTTDRLTIHDWYTGTGVIENITLDDGSALSVANVVRSYETPSGDLAPVITSLGDFSSWVGFHYPDDTASANLGNIMQALNDARIPGPGGSLAIDNTYGNPYGELLGDIFERASGLNVLVPGAVADAWNNLQRFVPRKDPLTFDLDGDGLETVGIDPANPILFDHDGDGVKTATGWIKADDAFLVLDRNGDGIIDNGTELFGDSTPLSTGGKAADGFAALADLDSNGDGKISSADAKFANLRLWQDLNQDGISQAGELFTLAQKGIASITVAKTENSTLLPNGNVIADLGHYTKTDGSEGTLGTTGRLGDVDLREETFYSQFTDTVPITPQTELLPNMHGSGQIRNLQEAASLSQDLAVLLQQYTAAATRAEQIALLDDLLKAWSDTSAMKTTATGAYEGHPLRVAFEGIADPVEHQTMLDKLTVLERFNGRTFQQVPAGTDPVTVYFFAAYLGGVGHIALLNEAYDVLRESVYNGLFLQTRGKEYLDAIGLTVDENGNVVLDFSGMMQHFDRKFLAEPLKGFGDLIDLYLAQGDDLKASGWDGLGAFVHAEEVLSTTDAGLAVLADPSQLGPDKDGFRFGSVAGDTLQGDGLANIMLGGGGDDLLWGREGADLLFGNQGNDTLFAEAGGDLLVGGEGDDLLDSGFGNDILDGGAGNDILGDANGNDTFIGGTGNDLLKGNDGSDTYHFNRGDGHDTVIDFGPERNDRFVFGPGIGLTDLHLVREGYNLTFDLGGGDQITVRDWFRYAWQANYEIEYFQFADGTTLDQITVLNTFGVDQWGTAGDDTLNGSRYVDRLYGNDGNDTLYAGDQNDRLEGGTGNDTLWGEAGNDTLLGDEGADILDSGFGDDILYGGAGDDTLQDANGSDSFFGGLGNDLLKGHDGIDTYYFNRGDGHDTVIDFGPERNDRFVFGQGIALSDFHLTRLGYDLLIDLGQGDSLSLSDWFQSGGGNREIEYFQFADGAILDQTQVLNTLGVDQWGTAGDDTLHGSFYVDRLHGAEGNDTVYAGDNHDTLDGGAGNDTLFAEAGGDLLVGGEGDDLLDSGFGNDILDGGAGNDILGDANGNDTFIGGTGNDLLKGNDGSDTYHFNRGDGHDTVIDFGPERNDRFVFGPGIGLTDLHLVREGYNLTFDLGGGDQITVRDWFRYAWQANYEIEYFQFSDNGITLGHDQVLSALPIYTIPTEGDDVFVTDAADTVINALGGHDTITDKGGNNILDAGTGNDWIWVEGNGTNHIYGDEGNDTVQASFDANNTLDGGAGDDVLLVHRTGGNANHVNTFIGGLGNDTLYGGAAADTYLYNRGDGLDTINDYDYGAQGATDTIAFGAGISENDVTVQRSGDHLLLRVLDPNNPAAADQITIQWWYADPLHHRVERFAFADGTVLTDAQMQARVGHGRPTLGTILSDIEVGDNAAFALGLPVGSFTDPDSGEVLTYRVTLGDGSALPGWLAFDSLTGALSGRPFDEHIGSYDIAVTAFDPTGYFATDSFTLTVINANDPPVIAAPIADLSTDEDAALNFLLPAGTFVDPNEGNVLTYNAVLEGGTNLPSWLAFDVQTQTFIGTPTNNEVGSLNITVTATDSEGLSVSDTFTLSVNNVNDAPVVMAAIPDQIMDEDAPFSFTLDTAIFCDDDFIHGDRLTLSATLADGNDLPTWLTFDALAGTFSGMPTNGNVGIYDVHVIATDESGANASTVFALTVNNTNDVPIVANAIADRITDEDAPISLDLTNIFSDDDLIHGDHLTLSASLTDGTALPGWLSFNATTGTFTGTPDNWQVGTYDIRITATDLAGTGASDVFTLTVNNVNDNPVLANALNDLTTDEDAPFSFNVPAGTFDDDDFIHGDSLTLSATLSDGSVLPDWLTFDATAGTFSGTPDNWDVGSYEIRLTATDLAGLSVSDTFTLAVNNVNDAPIVANVTPDQLATEGTAFSYAVAGDTFHDDDAIHGDVLSYTASLADGSVLPSWLSFDANTQSFTGTAPVNSSLIGTDGDDVLVDSDTGISGIWDVKVIATDTSGVSAEDAFTLTLQGVAGNDALNGGKGNDILNGGGGNDTYLYNYGDGLDTLSDREGQDAVTFGAEFSFDNTVIRVDGATGVAHLRFLNSDGNEGGEGVDIALNVDGTSPVETFAFADGSTYTLDDLLIRSTTHYGTTRADTIATGRHDDTIYAGNGTDTVRSGSGHDILYGDNGNDSLYGEGGNDRLFGGNGDDLLNGGAGNDILEGGHGHNTLIGGRGDDTILLALGENTIRFDLGDGCDTLTTEGAEVEDNDLEFGAGIAQENLWFSRNGNDLQIDVLGTTDRLTFQNWYTAEHKPLEEIRTANGYELGDKQVELLVQAMATFSPISGSGNVLPAEMPDSLHPVLAAAWESHG